MKDPIVFFNGAYVNKGQVKISPDDRGFLLGDGVYEVIKTYHGRLFEFDAHLLRLKHSLESLDIRFETVNDLESVCLRLLHDNDLTATEAMIYLQITRGVAKRTHCFPAEPVNPTVYLMAGPCQSRSQEQAKGVKIVLQPDIRWARCDIKTVALVANVLASQQAVQKGAAEAVFIRDGAVTEGASSNFFAVFDSVVVTHPKSHYILPGITRRVVLELCSKIGIGTKEYPILESRLETADEMMIVSTINEIVPVVQYNDKKVGNGAPGPVARHLQQAFSTRVERL